MRIAMIGQKRVPSREGGVEIVVEELSKRLIRDGNEVNIYNRDSNNVFGEEYNTRKELKGAKTIWVRTPERKSLNAIVYSFKAAWKAALSNAEIVHFHAEGPASMLLIPKLFRKKTAVTIHGLDWKRSKLGGFAKKYLLFGERMAAHHADALIVLSDSDQAYFRAVYDREPVIVRNGMAEVKKKEADEITTKFGLTKDGYILYLGRLVPEKKVETLIHAFKGVHTDKKLVIAGGPSHSPEYVEYLKQESKEVPNILFTGFVQGNILKKYKNQSYGRNLRLSLLLHCPQFPRIKILSYLFSVTDENKKEQKEEKYVQRKQGV